MATKMTRKAKASAKKPMKRIAKKTIAIAA
jgi:hypothetical protein